MAVLNTFSTDIVWLINEEKKAKKSSKKKKSSKGNPFSKLSASFIKIANNEKLTKSVGLFLLASSAFLLLAFSSFLFTWQVDKNINNKHWNDPT